MATTPRKFAKLRQVTLGVLKLSPKEPRYLCIVDAMHVSADIAPDAPAKDSDKPAAKKKEPATVAHALDMETGEEGVLICSAMLRSQLQREYPGDGYVGRGFELVSTKVPDKAYNVVSITEVEVPDDIVKTAAEIRRKLRASREGAAAADAERDAKAQAKAKANA